VEFGFAGLSCISQKSPKISNFFGPKVAKTAISNVVVIREGKEEKTTDIGQETRHPLSNHPLRAHPQRKHGNGRASLQGV
jgi:hypothetical protein